MVVRYFLFSLVVGCFAWLARAIVMRTRHLERGELESGLRVVAEQQDSRARRRLRFEKSDD